MPNYKCSRCHKVFTQKGHYNNHMERKIPCEENKEEIVPEPEPPKPEPKMIWMSIAGKNYLVSEEYEGEDEQAIEIAKGETPEQAVLRFYGC